MKRQKSHQFIVLVVFSIIGLVLFSQPVSAQNNSGLTMEAQASYDGNFKYGEWLPIQVTLENTGTDLDTVLKATINQSGGNVTFAKRVSLPSGSRKLVTLYILPNNFSREIEIQLSDEEEVLVSQTVEVSPNQNDSFIIGIASPDWGPLTQIAAITFEENSRTIVLAEINPDTVPEKAVALNSFDTIILNDMDTSNLNEAQQAALAKWVQNGGFLIIGGGTGIERTISGLPTSLTPFEITGYVEATHLSELEKLADDQPILLDGPFSMVTTASQSETVQPSDESFPILHKWQVGSGVVSLVSLNLTEAPFNAWSGTPAFWENLLGPEAEYANWMPRDMSLRQMRASNMYYPLSNLPALDLPSIKSLGILLIFYIAAIGPANYLLLKKWKKLQLAWATIPLLTVVFALAAFGLAYGLRGSDIVTNKLSIISLDEEGYANINSYVGVFSPAQESYEIEVSGDLLLSPTTSNYYDAWSSSVSPTIGETIFMQNTPAKVIGLEIGQWSMQTFNSENTHSYFGTIDSQLTLSEGFLKGEILNQSDITIKDAVLVFGNQMITLGDLEPNITVPVEEEIVQRLSDNLYNSIPYEIVDAIDPTGGINYSRDYELRRSMLETTFQPYGYWVGPDFEISTPAQDEAYFSNFYLVGWVDSSPPEVSINGKEATQNTLGLVTTHLPIIIEQGKYTIPNSLLDGEISQQPLNGGYCGGSSKTYIYLDYGSAEFDFHVPSALQTTQIDNLLLEFQEEISQWSSVDPGIAVSIYDWENSRWSVISDIENGINSIANNGKYINPEGLVRVQVDKESQNTGGCIFVSLGLEGSMP
ncbi:hypothetical protein KQH54_03220 [bacterium]|nr:hypothetical protein [bacterium]